MSLDAVIIEPQSSHKATVIWLHGLGDSGDGFAPIVPELNLPAELGVKFIFPHAPIQPVTINGGMAMRSWYDIKSLDLDKRADEQGVQQSAAAVQQLIDAEIDNGIAPSNIILAGFSQGGVVSLYLAPRLPYQLAGVMALSTYMCEPAKLKLEKQQASLNVFMAHGSFDDVVPTGAGKAAHQTLLELGYEVSWQEYPMTHQVCLEEIKAIRTWLVSRLN
ncbi:alpha/beta hydrolase [Pseudoalteromonas spongiae]|uniref:alpha/beta hydrolase n=1 Tax=Pseudoalteromonas spongiae TaxID=298657 RepID=UPI00026CAF47|nr:carboxylesterase [Pseudoalteromonas spongiae]ATC97319.1 phospholipase/carboxylesterase [Pseudoalteromonas spongiae UST010723-006]